MIMDGVTSAPWANEHVQLKFSDRQGNCLGQGTFVLPSLPAPSTTTTTTTTTTSTTEETKFESLPLPPHLARSKSSLIQEVRVPLSSAGTRQGFVEMEVRVRKIPLQKKGIPLSPSQDPFRQSEDLYGEERSDDDDVHSQGSDPVDSHE